MQMRYISKNVVTNIKKPKKLVHFEQENKNFYVYLCLCLLRRFSFIPCKGISGFFFALSIYKSRNAE